MAPPLIYATAAAAIGQRKMYGGFGGNRGSSAAPAVTADSPLHQAHAVEVDAVEHEQTHVGVLEGGFL